MPSFSDLRFYSIPPIQDNSEAPRPSLLQRLQLDLWAGQLYLEDSASYSELCAFLGIDLETPGHGPRQSDGFVKPGDRPVGGRMDEICPFEESPMVALRKLVGLRRKGMEYWATHVGQILHSRGLKEKDIE
ncbi:hypothetical protein BV25DRAFT_1803502 [Artomyces pyxidatus]|uniref:Uncharacterized protein n=1 Tax=Artomyces pyxidatus TaxID=48021 RepID=A0ACB8T1K4_9AGAM|nr:hypothetical protein BV25DRAFT_1803502 [Artomyces pyxidatus]